MTISRKIILSLLWSILLIAIVNIVSFYLFYSYYFQVYLSEKTKTKNEITIDYVNKIIEKQTLDEVDNIFNDIELSFFELLEKNQWKIKLDNKENIDVVVNYLSRAWVNIKYIEEVIPKNYLEEIKANSGRYNIENADINSEFSDYGSSFLGNKLVFTSARDTGGISKKVFKWTNQSFTNLYSSEVKKNGTLEVGLRIIYKANAERYINSSMFSLKEKSIFNSCSKQLFLFEIPLNFKSKKT